MCACVCVCVCVSVDWNGTVKGAWGAVIYCR